MNTSKQLFSKQNLKFILFDVLQINDLSKYACFEAHDSESHNLVLETATTIAANTLRPSFVDADRNQPQLIKGKVKVHPALHEFVKSFSASGLLAATFTEDYGGIQLPKTIAAAVDFTLCTAANSFIMYTDLAIGIADLIASFGTDTQKLFFLPKILSGEWLGTMCLTETSSGSSLANITTSAKIQTDNSYRIKGQKIFISAGDHDISKNIIHLVLARIEGAPQGVRGISLFIVPKIKDNGKSNDVTSIAMYHKMGQKATPAMHLGFGEKNDCTGYLLGEANKGLQQMFVMMDAFRLSVGLTGTAIASSAYTISLQYAKERIQGKRLNKTLKSLNPTAIIQHPDVRRMLLKQKAFVEGGLSFVLQCYLYLDKKKGTKNSEERNKYTQLLNLLTPVAKTYGAEEGVSSVNMAMQVLGGYGYTEDFIVEQLARDVRILPIYEGTTGIHSLGLLQRQILADNLAAFKIWKDEVFADIVFAKDTKNLEGYAEKLSLEIENLEKTSLRIKKRATVENQEVYLADATLYMEAFGILNIAWQWLKQAIIAESKLERKTNSKEEIVFYESKIHTMQYFFHYELPKIKGLLERLEDETVLTVFKEDKEYLI